MPATPRRRRGALLAVLAAGLATLVPSATASAATSSATSTNWAGYTVVGNGVSYRRVSGSWVQPPASCASGGPTYAAAWVGLGGYRASSKGLEQIGTESDCTASGRAKYVAWWELVPSAARTIKLTIRAGDRMAASVTVSGRRVTLHLTNLTTGKSFATTQTPSAVDLTSAEWIMEAPSACYDASANACEVLPLTDFGTASFAGAKAVTTGGHTGTVSDPAWSTLAISMSSAGSGRFGGPERAVDASAVQAAPGPLSTDGSGFDVTFQSSGPSNGAAPGTVEPGGPPGFPG
jgi:hypothetical protein